jgi:hypothetical protein
MAGVICFGPELFREVYWISLSFLPPMLQIHMEGRRAMWSKHSFSCIADCVFTFGLGFRLFRANKKSGDLGQEEFKRKE